MHDLRYILILFFAALVLPLTAQKGMTNKKLEKLLRSHAHEIEGQEGSWVVHWEDHLLVVLTDEVNNRMRIFTPIAQEEDIPSSEYRKMLEANFHSALDAKYSLSEGFVVSAFTHPFRELTRGQFLDAIRQVVNLAVNFGGTYSSTDLIFGEGQQPDKKINVSPSREKRS